MLLYLHSDFTAVFPAFLQFYTLCYGFSRVKDVQKIRGDHSGTVREGVEDHPRFHHCWPLYGNCHISTWRDFIKQMKPRHWKTYNIWSFVSFLQRALWALKNSWKRALYFYHARNHKLLLQPLFWHVYRFSVCGFLYAFIFYAEVLLTVSFFHNQQLFYASRAVFVIGFDKKG